MASVYSSSYQALLARLRAARRDAGLTQAEVAQVFGRPQSFVAKCESGERRIDAVELARFADLYRHPLEYFVGARLPGGAQVASEGGPEKGTRASRRAPPPVGRGRRAAGKGRGKGRGRPGASGRSRRG